ncbi:MAG: enoyl-CoA hydratase/isomerase family protein [Rubrivivax sp.]|nr:enoyl-CoA hydratase/isomerase family protein [Rubrivivax sp.]
MLELHQEGPVARLRIRRAEKKNALNEPLWRALLGHLQALEVAARARAPQAARVLLLQGEGGAFCAGADIEEMAQLMRTPGAMLANMQLIDAAQRTLENLPLPTLAVIDGPCFGGGFGLAAACDMRLASTRSLFAITPSRLGLLYSLNDTRRLVRLVGDARARRLLLRGERIDADTAAQWGVLHAVLDPAALDAAAQALAEELAGQSRGSMAGIKAMLAAVSSSPDAPTPEALHAQFVAAFESEDFAEGSAAFLGKRAARFP